ncbi:MAG: DUF4870 domain-containing protein [Aquificaceae bacterium]
MGDVREDRKIDPLAILSYIGILCLIPLLIGNKEDEFVRFHVRQGFALFLCEVATFFISWIPFFGWIVAFFGWFLWVILSIIGIINVIRGTMKPLPLIGQFGERLDV